MRTHNLLPVFLAALVATPFPYTLHAQAQNDPLDALVQTAAQRLQLAHKVALAKWDSGANVDDPAREKQVIDNAVSEGESRQLDAKQVRAFFEAQIEANKVVQYSLLSGWQAAGAAPPHKPVDLAKEIRPQLDQIQIQLMEELAASATARSSQNCRVQVAHAVQAYLAAQHANPDGREGVALERAMGATCAH
jgi:chorismate mutase